MCARPLGAAVRRVRWPTNEYEYDGVWNEACVRELSVFPTTTGAPPHEFHTYLNQQDEELAAEFSYSTPCVDQLIVAASREVALAIVTVDVPTRSGRQPTLSR